MHVDTLNTIDDSVVFGSVALMVCMMVIIIAFLNSTNGQNESIATERNDETNEPEVITVQPTAAGSNDVCCLACTSWAPQICHPGNCGCICCDCCTGCDGCVGCDACAGCDGCAGCDSCISADLCMGCDGFTGCEFLCNPEICCMCLQ